MHINIIFSIVLCGCETWSLTLREERRLRGFENRVLRRILWPKRNEVTVECGRLYNEELCALCFVLVIKDFSGDQIKINHMGGALSMCREDEKCIQVLVGKPEGKRPLGRHA
jgi:hypothetical protein